MRPLYESFRWKRPTFAIDLPGYGLSDRAALCYSPALYALVLTELLRKVRARHGTADVVALGRGAEAAAHVAAEEQGLVRSLALLEPAGLLSSGDGSFESLAARFAISCGQRAARGLFALMSTRPWIKHTLAARFFGEPDPALLEYAQQSAQVPGAHHAPLAALAAAAACHRRDDAASSIRSPFRRSSSTTRGARTPSSSRHSCAVARTALRCACRPRAECLSSSVAADTVSALERFWQSLSGAAWDQAMRMTGEKPRCP